MDETNEITEEAIASDSENPSNDNLPIYLTYLNGTGYVFNVDDYMKLRTEYRIVGNLVGTSNSRGWSANSCSIPVELTKFETRLLIEKGIAVLVRKPSLALNPSQELVDEYIETFEKRIFEQAHSLKEKKIQKCKKNIDKIILGKKKKLIKSGITESDIQISEEEVLDDIRRRIKFERNNSLLEIPCEHQFEHIGEIVKLEPNEDCLRYRVFKDIWEKGKFITSGEAFGADFIAYPDDPTLFHASHIIVILKDSRLSPLELIAKCRLSVIVNKICVYAYESTDGKLSYQTVHWEGCKDKTN